MPSCETVQQLFCHILFLSSAFICKLFLIEIIYLWRNLGSSIWINSQPHDALPFFQIGFTCSAPHFFVTLDIVRFIVLKGKGVRSIFAKSLNWQVPLFRSGRAFGWKFSMEWRSSLDDFWFVWIFRHSDITVLFKKRVNQPSDSLKSLWSGKLFCPCVKLPHFNIFFLLSSVPGQRDVFLFYIRPILC